MDKRWRPLELEMGDHVFLEVTPTTGVGRVIKSKKLTLSSLDLIRFSGV